MAKTTTPKNVLFTVNSEDLLHMADDTAQFEPGEHTIRNILAFSKAYEVKSSKNLAHIEHLLN